VKWLFGWKKRGKKACRSLPRIRNMSTPTRTRVHVTILHNQKGKEPFTPQSLVVLNMVKEEAVLTTKPEKHSRRYTYIYIKNRCWSAIYTRSKRMWTVCEREMTFVLSNHTRFPAAYSNYKAPKKNPTSKIYLLSTIDNELLR